ncbi:hypothetical protein WDM22_38375 [Bradyrhizobium septentrionale]|uniref:hypothetical protein n=1 Tax=Bradyrhizobium septentrionale TaxID=1404411 RepID=UPI0030D26299
MEQAKDPPCVDPDCVPETLCLGKFNVMFNQMGLATLTFTHPRAKTGPLLDQGQIEDEGVVRARIVTSSENMVAMRDLLNSLLKDTPAAPATTSAGGGKLN